MLATVSPAAIAYAGASVVGGNGFVAAFVAGLAVGTTARPLLRSTAAFAEADGQLLALFTFMLFGAVALPLRLPQSAARHAIHRPLAARRQRA